jgi:hypothetical protein
MKRQLQMIKNMGIGWAVFRVQYEARKKFGILERQFPPVPADWDLTDKLSVSIQEIGKFPRWWRENKPVFFFTKNEIRSFFASGDKQTLIAEADRALNNEFLYFSRWHIRHKGIDWHINPLSEVRMPSNVHWSRIEELSPEAGDVKYIWELSRFPFVYYWVRAFAVTGDEKYAEAFWKLFEDWNDRNPVELGVNWKCSQEMSLRVMAWLFALYAFGDTEATTDVRLIKLFKQLYCHGRHIYKNFDFALKGVRNNHVISEAAGLFTLGLLCPFFAEAKQWTEKGKKYLEAEGLRQIYPDGSYLQHSFNYQRLVLQLYSWCLRLGKLHAVDLSVELRERVKRCVLFLYHQQDEFTGQVPIYGENDGTLAFPLSDCEYTDYRPSLQVAHYLLTGKRLYPDGSYDEELFWFCGENALSAKVETMKRESKRYKAGGYYIIRGNGQFAMTRCTTYKNRPSQADMLHFDLWCSGVNVLCDAGTYSYNTGAEWLNYFKGTASHNTLMIDGQNQMKKGPRFLWFDWTKGKTIAFETNKYQLFEGEHYGYGKIKHRRGILHVDNFWVIVDDIFGTFAGTHTITQSWLSGADVCRVTKSGDVTLETKCGAIRLRFLGEADKARIYYGDSAEIRGWRSLYYGEKIPAYQIVYDVTAKRPVRLITLVFPEGINGCDLDSILDRTGIALGVIGADRIFIQ